jgi:hypothetical protein
MVVNTAAGQSAGAVNCLKPLRNNMKDQMIIRAQAREWCGDEDHVIGRYKLKGRRDYFITLDHSIARYNVAEVRTAFNEIYDQEGMNYRAEFVSMELYNEPDQIKDIDSMLNLINVHIDKNLKVEEQYEFSLEY